RHDPPHAAPARKGFSSLKNFPDRLLKPRRSPKLVAKNSNSHAISSFSALYNVFLGKYKYLLPIFSFLSAGCISKA
ncbi:MAG: hypothetical protein KDG89_17460, partial [Geminicoccaceae bacterium]|nr:hypothetical protein [Geminicoccaceae bacterium]